MPCALQYAAPGRGQVYTAASQVALSEDLGELGSVKSCGKKVDVKC